MMKRIIKNKQVRALLLTFMLLMANTNFAKAETMTGQETALFIVAGITLLAAILVLLVCVYVLYTFKGLLTKGSSPEAKSVKKSKEGLFENLLEKINRKFGAGDFIPIEREKDIMLDHSYDGISELNNHMPPWLKYLFYTTIGFAAVYLSIYLVFDTGKSQIDEYHEELAQAEKLAEERQSMAANSIDESTVVFNSDQAAIEAAKTIFSQNCAACHGQEGEGTVGPNLTDEYWLHGGSIKDVFKVIKYGVQEKGMIPWQDKLNPEEIQNVASFILTLKGTTPPNPKAPQGEKYVEEEVSDGSMSSL